MAALRHLVNGNPVLFAARHALNVLPALRPGDRQWSEGREDAIVLDRAGDRIGWYADIGAQNPVKQSNTYRLYRRGWSGIVVEPNAELARFHALVRRRDRVVCAGIGREPGEADYFEMSPQVLSTFSTDARDHYLARGDRLLRTSTRRLLRLEDLFDEQAVDGWFGVLSVDVEGWDLPVLQSNDWKRWRPLVVIAEANDAHSAADIRGYLDEQGYDLSEVVNDKNGIYVDRST